MNRWFRVYHDMIDDPKVQRLPPDLFKALVNLWCLASQNDGLLPSVEDIAFKLRLKDERVKQIVSSLHEAGLIDTEETGLKPHNWDGRQYKSDVSTVRVKAFRKRQRNVSSSVTVTPPDTDSETDRERKQDAPPLAAPPMNDETEVYRRGKDVLGTNAGGMIKNLIKAKSGSIPHARAAIEIASTKHNAREYIGAIINGTGPPDDARARGDAW